MKQQKGFAHAGLVLVLVVALVGTLGFIFWQNFIKQDDDSTNETRSSSQKTTVTKKSDTKQSYKGVYTEGGSFQVKIPNGWTVEAGPLEANNSSHPYAVLLAGPNNLKSLQYDEEAEPVINKLPGLGWDGLTEHFFIQSGEKQDISKSIYRVSSYKLLDGTEGLKYTRVISKDDKAYRDGFQQQADRYTATVYEFSNEDTTVYAYLNYYSNTKFDLDLGDDVIRSMKFEQQ